MASHVHVQLDLQVCNAKKTSMTANPVRAQIMGRALFFIVKNIFPSCLSNQRPSRLVKKDLKPGKSL